MSELYHKDLPAGTFVRHVTGGSRRVRVIEMHGDFAYCEYVKEDGSRDQRTRGWSGLLPTDVWAVEKNGRYSCTNLPSEPCKDDTRQCIVHFNRDGSPKSQQDLDFATFVQNVRTSTGVYDEDLGNVVNTNPTIIEKWRRGHSAPKKTLRREIVRLLGRFVNERNLVVFQPNPFSNETWPIALIVKHKVKVLDKPSFENEATSALWDDAVAALLKWTPGPALPQGFEELLRRVKSPGQ